MSQSNMRAFIKLKAITKAAQIFLIIVPVLSFSQINKIDIKSQRLLLELGAGYLNVVRENQIDLDSGLALAAKRNHLSRMSVFAEGDEGILNDPSNKWIATENIEEVRKEALSAKAPRRIQLLNILASYYVFQPTGRKNDLDSALFYLMQARREAEASGEKRILCKTLRLLGKYYLDNGDLAQADKTFAQVIDISQKYGYQQEEAMSLLFWAAFSPFQPNKISERITHLKIADTLFERTGDIQNQIVAKTDVGYLSFAAGKIADSKNSFLEVLDLEKKIRFPFTQYTTDLLSLIALIQGQQGETLVYATSGLKAAEANGDNAIIGYIYGRMGDANNYRHYGQESAEWFLKALNEYAKVGDDPYRTANAIVGSLEQTPGNQAVIIKFAQQLLKRFPPTDSLQKQGFYLLLAKQYTSLHSFSDAENYLNAAEKIQGDLILLHGKIYTGEFDYQMASGFFNIHKYGEARIYFEKMLIYSETLDKIRYQAIEKYLYKIDSLGGNFRGAFSHLKKHEDLGNLINDEKQAKTNEGLRIQYETEKKDNSIKILNQQGEIQKALIKHERFTRNVMIGGAAVLLLFLVLFYNRYRLKQSQQKVITQKNVDLQHLVGEKEFLMKEIHHRVKNNLQIVISLLNTQSKFLNNEEAIAAISESRHRMQAMSLIHQKLYQSENAAFVAMPVYIRELVDYLDMSFNVGQKIKFELDIDPIDLDISQAIPVGLILNEAVTNCIKHAFTDRPNGTIRVVMKKMQDEFIFLEISDDGKGLPTDFDFTTSQSLGIRLIRGLIEQIGGELNFSDLDGCRIATTFKQDLVLGLVAV